MSQVEFKSVSKIFPGGGRAVDDLNLDIADKEFCVLVGPSGSGKSTILRMVAGLEDITEGEIHIGGRLVNPLPPKERDVAMVFQNYALYPHWSAFENMAFGLKMRRFQPGEIDRRVREAADILGISELLDHLPKKMSGGERQRVAVGRAIVRQPQVFLFDEPLSNLDAQLRIQLRGELTKLHQRLQATMIYVTHDQLEAMTMGQRIVVINKGRVQQVDDPQTLYDLPANLFVAGFIGSPPMSFINGACQNSGERLSFEAESVALDLPDRLREPLKPFEGKEMVFGIRPEHIQPVADESGVPEAAAIEAEVEMVEPIGSEKYVHLQSGSSRLVARLGADTAVNPGERQTFTLDLLKAHFFDKETEQRIT